MCSPVPEGGGPLAVVITAAQRRDTAQLLSLVSLDTQESASVCNLLRHINQRAIATANRHALWSWCRPVGGRWPGADSAARPVTGPWPVRQSAGPALHIEQARNTERLHGVLGRTSHTEPGILRPRPTTQPSAPPLSKTRADHSTSMTTRGSPVTPVPAAASAPARVGLQRARPQSEPLDFDAARLRGRYGVTCLVYNRLQDFKELPR